MTLDELTKEYDKLQEKYGAKELDSIYFGGCETHPDICFVFMNPTKRNIASSKTWHGLKAPWIGTKNIWELFYNLKLLDEEIYLQIKSQKGKEWTEEFANTVYENVKKHKYFLTNLGKCTQLDARPLPDTIFKKYVFGNQVSSIVLNQKIAVSQNRKKCYIKKIKKESYKFYPVYYPVGNGRFNIDKTIEDINWIITNECNQIGAKP